MVCGELPPVDSVSVAAVLRTTRNSLRHRSPRCRPGPGGIVFRQKCSDLSSRNSRQLLAKVALRGTIHLEHVAFRALWAGGAETEQGVEMGLLVRSHGNNSRAGTPSAVAIFWMLTRLMFRSPRSTPPMYVRSRSQAMARASWESRLSVRNSRRRRPKVSLAASLCVVTTTGITPSVMSLSPRTISSGKAHTPHAAPALAARRRGRGWRLESAATIFGESGTTLVPDGRVVGSKRSARCPRSVALAGDLLGLATASARSARYAASVVSSSGRFPPDPGLGRCRGARRSSCRSGERPARGPDRPG